LQLSGLAVQSRDQGPPLAFGAALLPLEARGSERQCLDRGATAGGIGGGAFLVAFGNEAVGPQALQTIRLLLGEDALGFSLAELRARLIERHRVDLRFRARRLLLRGDLRAHRVQLWADRRDARFFFLHLKLL
jgi:hypothetical protein